VSGFFGFAVGLGEVGLVGFGALCDGRQVGPIGSSTNASLRRASSADSTISLAWVYFMAFLSLTLGI
jgi:hypothetical protein